MKLLFFTLIVFSLGSDTGHFYPPIGRGLYRFTRFLNGGCYQCEQDYDFDIGRCIDEGIGIHYRDHHPGEQTCEDVCESPDNCHPPRARATGFFSNRLQVQLHADRDCEGDAYNNTELTKNSHCINDKYGYDWDDGGEACHFEWCSYTDSNCSGPVSCITLSGGNCVVSYLGMTYVSRTYVHLSPTLTRFYMHFTPDCTSKSSEVDFVSDGECHLEDRGVSYTMTWNNYETCFDSNPPTVSPTRSPTSRPTGPSRTPSKTPSRTPSSIPTNTQPTIAPSVTSPSHIPTKTPSSRPSRTPSIRPSNNPSTLPTPGPSIFSLPTTSPSTTPSFAPTENRFPTLGPSFSFPSVSPTLVACAQAARSEMGSKLLGIDEESSMWNSNDELIVVLRVPIRFTVKQIRFEGATDDVGEYLDGEENSIWSLKTDENNCMQSFTSTLTWTQISNGAMELNFGHSQIENSPQYLGYIWTNLEETVNFGTSHLHLIRETITRNSEYQTPFLLILEEEIKLDVNFTWIVDEPDFVNIKDGFAIFTPNADGLSQVQVNFTTYNSFPWEGNGTYTLTDTNNIILDGTDNLKVLATECFPEEKTYCIQKWTFTFLVDAVCSVNGIFTLNVPIYWDYLMRFFDVNMNVYLGTACAQVVDQVPLAGTLISYTDVSMTNPAERFYLDDMVYLRATLNNYMELSSARIVNVMVYQYDEQGNLIVEKNAASERGFDVNIMTSGNNIDDLNVLDLGVKLSSEYLYASVDGVVTTVGVVIEVIYLKTHSRRLLSLPVNNVQLDKRFRAFPTPCSNPRKEVGNYVQIPCFQDSSKSVLQICEKAGWKVLKDPCGFVGKISMSSRFSRETLWSALAMICSICLILAILILIFIYVNRSGGSFKELLIRKNI